MNRTEHANSKRADDVPGFGAGQADLPHHRHDLALAGRQETLVPLLRPMQKLEFGALGLLWLVATFFLWDWWLDSGHNIGTARYVLSTTLLAWITFCSTYFIYIFYNSLIPARTAAFPRNHRVAMVVTKTPSEPFAVVRETLEAMLRQTYPHDTWLADEDPLPETINWCEAHGVRISTRKGRADYHRPNWPRRTRCKEGNLAFFYDHYGYDNYDFVSQFDADHVPEESYLEEILQPFIDPRIGYVSAPSICNKNASKSWSARGRLYEDAAMHGVVQAGYTNGLAPLCIGSHYAVRTIALIEIGGIGPELAEDHSTTFFMNAFGWRGVHAFSAVAHGDGPGTFADMVTQEFQWSRSLMTLLLSYTPSMISRLSLNLRFQFLFCQLFYTLSTLFMLASFFIPVFALLFDVNMAGVTYPEFILHTAVPEIVVIMMVIRIARHGWCRPANARVISWERALYILARWPWWLLGTLSAVRDWATGTFVDFHVTPKGENMAKPLPFRVLIPYMLLSLGSGLPVLALNQIKTASGFYILALINCIIYAALTITIVVKHAQESRQSWLIGPTAIGGGRFAWGAIVGILVLVPAVALPLRAPHGLKTILVGADQVAVQFIPESLMRFGRDGLQHYVSKEDH
jgi:cellulose synthase (UDP-forming)